MKRFLSILLAICMCLSLLPLAVFGAEESYDGKTVILHTNDIHGNIVQYAYVAGLKKDMEAKGADVILADAGDYCQGSTYVNSTQGVSAIELMNEVGYDIATIGNHEFDFGYKALLETLNGATFNVVCANIYDGENSPLFDDSEIIERGGIKVGFFGLDTPETLTKSNPANTAGLSFLTKDTQPTLFQRAQECTDELKQQGADLVICLSHLGVDKSSEPYRSYDLWNATNGIDFIIDGHSHDVLTQGENGEPIQSTGSKLENIGVIVLDESTKKIESHTLVKVDETVPTDAEIVAKAEEIIKAQESEPGTEPGDQVIGVSQVDLNGEKDPGNRTEETNLGDFVTDATVWYCTEKNPNLITEVEPENIVAVNNGGGLRAWIHKGNVTVNDIFNVVPFGNTVDVVYVTGAELLEALEASTFCTPDSVGGFPQIAGMDITVDTTVAYDANEEPYPGSVYYGPKSIRRVSINSINGKLFDSSAKYAVITNDFCSGGGDTYNALGRSTEKIKTGAQVDTVIADYLVNKLDGSIGMEYAEPQGRITIIKPKDGSMIIVGGLDANVWVSKYGNIYTDCEAETFRTKLSFEWGDMVKVSFSDRELTVPVVPSYSYVENGEAAVIMQRSPDGTGVTGYISLAVNMGNFAETYGIAKCNYNEDGTWYYTAMDGVTFPLIIRFDMADKAGYYSKYIAYDLQRTNSREDYAALSDAQFANFRAISTAGIKENVLYRGSSPINPKLGRNTYADNAAKQAGINTVINLDDNEQTAKARDGFADSFCSGRNVLYLSLGINFASDAFKTGVAECVRFINENPAPYYIHCLEGKDKVGFVAAVLECLTGASLGEVTDDYMLTYNNYFGLEKGSEKYDMICNKTIMTQLQKAFATDDLEKEDLSAKAAEYLLSAGLDAEEIAMLVKTIGHKHQLSAYSADGNATCTKDGTKTATCLLCGENETAADKGSKLGHAYGAYKSDKNATCTKNGTKTAKCTRCGAKKTVTDKGSKTGHSYKTVVTKATTKANGKTQKVCKKCGKVASTAVIYRPKTVKLSKTTFTYNGKTQKPTVTVKDAKGKTISSANYKVSFSSSKYPGKYKLTVTFTGSKYTGKLTASYKIVLGKVAGVKLTAAKGSKVKIAFNKTTGATKYIIYKADSKTGKYKKLATTSKISYTTGKYKAGTKLYIKVKACKTVKGVNHYGEASSARAITVKK